MTERQKTLLRLAIVCTSANLTDLIETFAPYTDEKPIDIYKQIDFNGETIDTPTEAEYEELMKILS